MANVNIKLGRWIVGLMVFLWGCIILCGYIIYSIVSINHYNELSNRIDQILIHSQKSIVAVKEFLINAYTDETFVMTGKNEASQQFYYTTDTVIKMVHNFKGDKYIDNTAKVAAYDSLTAALKNYQQVFQQIAYYFKQKGFKDLGLEGRMRKAIHFIEKHEAPIDLEYMLTLRRHEKDFLLRKDIKYMEKFDKDIVVFEEHIKNHPKIYPEYERESLLKALDDYQVCFDSIVYIEKEIGLEANKGLRQKLTANIATVENVLNRFNADIKERKQAASYAINLIIGSIIVVFVCIIAGVIISIRYFNQSVQKPIQKLNQIADQIAAGNLSLKLDEVKSSKLLSELVNSFEKLLVKLRLTIQQLQDIASRKIKQEFELNSANDDIGRALNSMIAELAHIDSEEAKRTWAGNGIALFSETVRTQKDLKTLCDKVITQLVKQLNANQGGMFLAVEESGETCLKLMAAYAYNRKKYIEKIVYIGEGLLGQAYLEKEYTYLTEVPDEYLTITSGLGHANPRCILIMPLVTNNEVEGVLEIASFTPLQPYQIEFVQKIAEITASAIATTKITEKTAQLLEESELQKEQMRAQEEEMRQNLEELKATYEDYSRKEQQHLQRIKELETEIATVKKQHQKTQAELEFIKKINSGEAEQLQNMEKLLRLREEAALKIRKAFPRRIEHFLDS